MSFLYFLPGSKQKPGPAALEAAGLAHAFDGAPEFCGVTGGPGGTAGVILGAEGLPRYYPDRQAWQAMTGSEAGVWIGRPHDTAIGPNDLARRTMLDGHTVTLADGNQWLAPIARACWPPSEDPYVYRVALPTVSTLDEAGRWIAGDVVGRYRALWDLAVAWHDHYFATDDEEADEADPFTGPDAFHNAHQAALDALAHNYRLGPDEADLLGLLTQENIVAVLHALIDLPGRLQIVAAKKKDGPPLAT